jgi:hypothetical protein
MPFFLSSLKNEMKMAAELMMGTELLFAVFSRMQREDKNAWHHAPRSGRRTEAIRLGVKSSPASTIATAVNLTEVFQ